MMILFLINLFFKNPYKLRKNMNFPKSNYLLQDFYNFRIIFFKNQIFLKNFQISYICFKNSKL